MFFEVNCALRRRSRRGLDRRFAMLLGCRALSASRDLTRMLSIRVYGYDEVIVEVGNDMADRVTMMVKASKALKRIIPEVLL